AWITSAMPSRWSKRVEPFSLRRAHPDELQKLVEIDDEASELFVEAGLELVVDKNHPFVVAESARWAEAIERGLAYVVVDQEDQPIGFATFRFVDGEPYIDQIA